MAAAPLPALRRPALHACTGLRFLAAMGVVCYHFYNPSQAPGVPAFLGKLFQAGFTTVSLFFVLSGFILAYNYLGERGGFVGTVGDFYRARFARIYPIYLLALGVDLPLFIHFLHQAEPAATPGEVARISVATLTLTQAWLELGRPTWNMMAWTLSAEAFFYTLFPFLGAWLARQSSRRLLAVAAGSWGLGAAPFIAGAMAPRLGTDSTGSLLTRGLLAWSELPQHLIPPTRLPEFILGVCLGLLFCRRTQAGSERRRTGGLLVTLAALTALIILLPPKPSPVVQLGLLVPLFALLIWLLAGGVAFNGLMVGSRPLVLLGGASYALYMLHGSVMGYALAVNTRTFSLPHNIVALLTAPLTVAASLLLFKVVEEPAREWLRQRARARVPAKSGGTG